jgi:hypothetical protein
MSKNYEIFKLQFVYNFEDKLNDNNSPQLQ